MNAAFSEDVLDLLSRVIRSERVGLVRIARREGLGPEDAVDCVQDALVTFLRLAHRGELEVAESAIGTYLAGVVRNAARNKRRLHHVSRPHGSLDLIEADADESPADAMLARAE